MYTRSTDRRGFLSTAARAAGGLVVAPALITQDSARPEITGVATGDVAHDRAIVWCRTDRAATMFVEWSTTDSFQNVRRVRGPLANQSTDFTARVDLRGLPADQRIFYRVGFDATSSSEPASAPSTFLTAPSQPRDVTFAWSADTVGQGWGINLEWGGLRMYETIRLARPDFFVHCGDTIYADGPVPTEVKLSDGSVWRNLVTPAKSKVAETLDEFRGNYAYNLLDENVRRFNAEVPQIWQWDDHEVTNNWSDSKDLSGDPRYTEKNVPLLIARGARAFLEYAPMRPFDVTESQRVYRKYSYGPLMELFVLDMRSYRGPNTANLQPAPNSQTAFLGREQLDWLKAGLESSRAVWKVVAADMPLGLNVGDGPRWEAVANGEHGSPKGRELEFAELLGHLKREKVRNVVWLTADVHYCAAHYYDPAKAAFRDFDGFWEFVSGPLNAGSFGPNTLDGTFGPQVVFLKAPPAGQSNLSPFSGLQFFGEVNIDAQGGDMTVDLRDINGVSVFTKTLQPRMG
jgi:alkaline phosphatase D